MDLACLVVGSVAGVTLRLGREEMGEYVFGHLEGWLLLFGGVILANYLAGSYRVQYTFSRFNLVVTWMFSLVFALLILSITSYAWFLLILGRGVLFFSLGSYSVLALFMKLLVYRRLFRSEVFMCRTAIIGSGKRAIECARMLEHRYVLPAHRVVACVRLPDEMADERPDSLVAGIAVIDSRGQDLESIIHSLDVQLVVLGLDDMLMAPALYPRLRRLRFEGIEVLSPLAVAETYSGRMPLEWVNEELFMQVSMESGLPMVWRAKRLMDVALSGLACVLLLPGALLVALLTKVSHPGAPVFYSQVRAGQFGKPFRIYKFRTMRPGAESETGPVWAAADDPRITALGRVLRRFRIDEVPQFVNILRGEMSLVGPRPERLELSERLAEKIPYYEERENVTPGLTGWAQIRYPYGSTVEDAARKLEYDFYYIKHLSLALDLQIVLSTLRIVLFGKERSV